MKVNNYKYFGLICKDEYGLEVHHMTTGKYNALMWKLGRNYRIIKYNNYYELLTDFRERLKTLANVQHRIITNTEYGDACIKAWYKYVYG